MRPRPAVSGIVLATVVLAGAAVAGAVSGGTFGMFSATTAATPSEAGAATVALGRGDGTGLEMAYDLSPGAQMQPFRLEIDYAGSVPADVALRLSPGDGGSPLCETGDGTFRSRLDAALTLQVADGTTFDYCGLLTGEPVPLASVEPGDDIGVDVYIRLDADAADEVSGLTQLDRVVVTAAGRGGGFTDEVEGALDLRVAAFATAMTAAPTPTDGAGPRPLAETARGGGSTRTTQAVRFVPVSEIEFPPECAAFGMAPEDFRSAVLLDGVTTWDGGKYGDDDGAKPFVVIGTDGAHTITGSAQGDCIVGGDGDDTVYGGEGDDVLVGGVGIDRLHGGVDADELHGGPGDDELFGGPGADRLLGGAEGATCDWVDDVEAAVDCAPPGRPILPAPSTNATPAPAAVQPSAGDPPRQTAPTPTPTPTPPAAGRQQTEETVDGPKQDTATEPGPNADGSLPSGSGSAAPPTSPAVSGPQ